MLILLPSQFVVDRFVSAPFVAEKANLFTLSDVFRSGQNQLSPVAVASLKGGVLEFIVEQIAKVHRMLAESRIMQRYEILDVCRSYLTPMSLLLIIASPN